MIFVAVDFWNGYSHLRGLHTAESLGKSRKMDNIRTLLRNCCLLLSDIVKVEEEGIAIEYDAWTVVRRSDAANFFHSFSQ